MTELLVLGIDGLSNTNRSLIGDKMPYLSKIENKKESKYGVLESYVTENSRLNAPETGPCLTPDMRIYTQEGWKTYKEVNIGDKTLSIDKNGIVEWKPVKQKIVKEHKGTTYEIESNKVSAEITPDHNIAYVEKGQIKRKKACDMPATFNIPTNGVHRKTREEGILLEDYGRDELIKLAAWYITEGWTNGKEVNLAKSTKSPHREEIYTLVNNKLNLSCWTDDNKINFYSKKIGSWLKENFGKGSINKKIPKEFIEELTSPELEKLFETLIDGDGARKEGNKYHTSSPQLRDAVMEIALRLGHSPSLENRGGGTHNIKGKDYEVNDRYRVFIAREKSKTEIRKHRHWEKKQYEGLVWDVGVEDNHTFLVERDGKVHFTSNCWTSLYTGLKAKEHGITSGGWTEGDSKFDQLYSVWDKLSENDVSVGMMSMPMTYPAKEVNGWMISGFVSTTLKSLSHKLFYPDELEEEVRDDYIESTAAWMAKKEIGGAEPKKKFEKTYPVLKKGEWNRVEDFKKIVKNRGKKDVLAFGTTFADKIGHIDGIDYTNDNTVKTYKEVDKIIKEVVEFVDPEDIMIISDHGFSGYSHDLKGYGLYTGGQKLNNLFEVTPTILNRFGVDYNSEEYGLTGTKSLSTEEKDDIKDQLRNLGYLE